METKKIEQALNSKVIEKEGKNYISCAVALKIANDMKVTPAEVGKLCNEMKIKIMNCQLGCF
jgi:hypothetical protein